MWKYDGLFKLLVKDSRFIPYIIPVLNPHDSLDLQEKHQKEIERQFKKKIYAEKKLANKQRQDSERQAKINARRERASFTFSKRSSPSGVKVTPRELRLKRIVSRFCSNFWIALLIAG